MKTPCDTSYQSTSASLDDESESWPSDRTSNIPEVLEDLENAKHPALPTGNYLGFLNDISIPSSSYQRHATSTPHTAPTYQSTSTYPILGDQPSNVEVQLEFIKRELKKRDQTVENQRIELNRILRETALKRSPNPFPPAPARYRRLSPPPPPTPSLELPPPPPLTSSPPSYRHTYSSSIIERSTLRWDVRWDGIDLSIPRQTDSQPGAWVGPAMKRFWGMPDRQGGPDLIDLATAEYQQRQAIQGAVIENQSWELIFHQVGKYADLRTSILSLAEEYARFIALFGKREGQNMHNIWRSACILLGFVGFEVEYEGWAGRIDMISFTEQYIQCNIRGTGIPPSGSLDVHILTCDMPDIGFLTKKAPIDLALDVLKRATDYKVRN